MAIVLVAAVAENGVIGADGEMPWHYPADLKRFKELTMGSPVVMGRRTYESIERAIDGPLPGRTNVVLSRRRCLELPEGAVHARNVEEALELAEAAIEGTTPTETGAGEATSAKADEGATSAGTNDEAIYVIGGRAVYDAFLERASELRITEIPGAPAGDTCFPEIGEEWREIDRKECGELSFVTYRR